MMEKKVFEKLIKKNLTIAFAESMTGGLLTYQMVKYPGASKVVVGSVVAYQSQIKETLLQVDPKTIHSFGVVSQEVADQMALGLFAQTKADICVSITGNAGPTYEYQSNQKEAYVSIYYHEKYHHYHTRFHHELRDLIIKEAVDFVYQKLNGII